LLQTAGSFLITNRQGISMDILVIFLISCLFAAFLYYLAAKRDADTLFWAVIGFLFGPFAIPFVFFSKPRKNTKKEQV
jgi:hypothetical protein